MATVYSVRFVAVTASTLGSVTVPAGDVAIIRDVDVVSLGGLSANNFGIRGSAGQAIWDVQLGGGDPTYAGWRGRQVLNPGETWTWASDLSVDLTVSGYLLSLP